MSISGLFEIGRRSLAGYQSAIDITSGNIANANNENYKRRRVDLRNLTINGIANGIGGNGANPSDLQRIRQKFAEHALWRENNQLGKYDKTESLLSQLESIFGDDSDGGLGSVMSQFWNSWNELSNDPENDSIRNLVANKGKLLSDTFNRTYNRAIRFQREMTPEINDTVKMINQSAQKLLDINNQIRVNDNPDLIDQRDAVLSDLSKVINIDVKENDKGEVSVFYGGHILISENKANLLQVKFDTTGNVHKASVVFKDSNYAPKIEGGSLAGMMDVYNNKIPAYLDKLDTLASSVVSQVNAIHKNGYNIAGTTGVDFFQNGVTSASDIKLNSAIENDPTLIATRAAGEGVGSNSVAEAIFKIQYATSVENKTVSDFYTDLVTGIGSDVDDASFLAKSEALITQQLQNQRDQVTGVSLDEEMTNMIKYQQSYQASAKIISTVDEMLTTVLNL